MDLGDVDTVKPHQPYTDATSARQLERILENESAKVNNNELRKAPCGHLSDWNQVSNSSNGKVVDDKVRDAGLRRSSGQPNHLLDPIQGGFGRPSKFR